MLESARYPAASRGVAGLRTVFGITDADNGSWGSTGSQPTPTSYGLNLAAWGAVLGTSKWQRVLNSSQWQALGSPSGQLVHFLIRPGNAAEVPPISIPAREITKRFQRAISQR